MITLNSVSYSVGKARFARVLLQEVNWAIKPKQRIVILGHTASGARALLDIIGGVTFPSSGWIDRRARVSIPGGVFRYAKRGDTTYQLICRISQLYRVDVKDVIAFLIEALRSHDFLAQQPRSLPGALRQQLTSALVYAFPFDFYLFQGTSLGGGSDSRFRTFCERAFELRTEHAGVIMMASSAKIARRISGEMIGALVYRGNLTLYRKLSDAIAVFESLPPEEVIEDDPTQEREPDNEEADSLLDL